jgi:hypothetical protein
MSRYIKSGCFVLAILAVLVFVSAAQASGSYALMREITTIELSNQ